MDELKKRLPLEITMGNIFKRSEHPQRLPHQVAKRDQEVIPLQRRIEFWTQRKNILKQEIIYYKIYVKMLTTEC